MSTPERVPRLPGSKSHSGIASVNAPRKTSQSKELFLPLNGLEGGCLSEPSSESSEDSSVTLQSGNIGTSRYLNSNKRNFVILVSSEDDSEDDTGMPFNLSLDLSDMQSYAQSENSETYHSTMQDLSPISEESYRSCLSHIESSAKSDNSTSSESTPNASMICSNAYRNLACQITPSQALLLAPYEQRFYDEASFETKLIWNTLALPLSELISSDDSDSSSTISPGSRIRQTRIKPRPGKTAVNDVDISTAPEMRIDNETQTEFFSEKDLPVSCETDPSEICSEEDVDMQVAPSVSSRPSVHVADIEPTPGCSYIHPQAKGNHRDRDDAYDYKHGRKVSPSTAAQMSKYLDAVQDVPYYEQLNKIKNLLDFNIGSLDKLNLDLNILNSSDEDTTAVKSAVSRERIQGMKSYFNTILKAQSDLKAGFLLRALSTLRCSSVRKSARRTQSLPRAKTRKLLDGPFLRTSTASLNASKRLLRRHKKVRLARSKSCTELTFWGEWPSCIKRERENTRSRIFPVIQCKSGVMPKLPVASRSEPVSLQFLSYPSKPTVISKPFLGETLPGGASRHSLFYSQASRRSSGMSINRTQHCEKKFRRGYIANSREKLLTNWTSPTGSTDSSATSINYQPISYSQGPKFGPKPAQKPCSLFIAKKKVIEKADTKDHTPGDWINLYRPRKTAMLGYPFPQIKEPDFTVNIRNRSYPCYLIVLSFYSTYFQRKWTVNEETLPCEKVSTTAFDSILKWMICDEVEKNAVIYRININDVRNACKYLGIRLLEQLCDDACKPPPKPVK